MTPLSELDIDAYLLPADEAPWGRLLANFSPPLPASFDLFLITRTLDFFVIHSDGSVHWLETQAGRYTRIADTRADFEAQMEWEYPHWLMTPLVDQARASGLRLAPGEAYAWKVPPMLGGEYSLENMERAPIHAALTVLGDLFRQGKLIPQGASVKLEVTPQ